MENPGYIALSRQMVLRRQMDVLAHNLANLTTPGYRGERMLFVETSSNTSSVAGGGSSAHSTYWD